MDWLKYLVQALAMVPYVVSGIESIHGSTISGASKKALAMQALGLSSSVAEAMDPGQAPVIQAATQLASSTIDGVVAVMKAATPKVAPSAQPVAAAAPPAVVEPAPTLSGSNSVVHSPAPVKASESETGGSAADVVFPSE